MRHIYFPTASIVSLLYVLKDGASAEIAVVGFARRVARSVPAQKKRPPEGGLECLMLELLSVSQHRRADKEVGEAISMLSTRGSVRRMRARLIPRPYASTPTDVHNARCYAGQPALTALLCVSAA